MSRILAAPARLPGISWWHVIVEVERHSYSHGQIAAAIDSSRTTVEGWKNRHAEPRHQEGERLIALWAQVTGKGREDLPRKTGGTLSAAQFR